MWRVIAWDLPFNDSPLPVATNKSNVRRSASEVKEFLKSTFPAVYSWTIGIYCWLQLSRESPLNLDSCRLLMLSTSSYLRMNRTCSYFRIWHACACPWEDGAMMSRWLNIKYSYTWLNLNKLSGCKNFGSETTLTKTWIDFKFRSDFRWVEHITYVEASRSKLSVSPCLIGNVFWSNII